MNHQTIASIHGEDALSRLRAAGALIESAIAALTSEAGRWYPDPASAKAVHRQIGDACECVYMAGDSILRAWEAALDHQYSRGGGQ